MRILILYSLQINRYKTLMLIMFSMDVYIIYSYRKMIIDEPNFIMNLY